MGGWVGVYNWEQAGFAEPHSSLTIGSVGVGFGIGLGWSWVGIGLGLKFGSWKKIWVPKKSRRSGGWVAGWDKRKIMSTLSQPTGFSHMYECGNKANSVQLQLQLPTGTELGNKWKNQAKFTDVLFIEDLHKIIVNVYWDITMMVKIFFCFKFLSSLVATSPFFTSS